MTFAENLDYSEEVRRVYLNLSLPVMTVPRGKTHAKTPGVRSEGSG